MSAGQQSAPAAGHSIFRENPIRPAPGPELTERGADARGLDNRDGRALWQHHAVWPAKRHKSRPAGLMGNKGLCDVVINAVVPDPRERWIRQEGNRDAQATHRQWKLIEPFLPIGEYGLYPERLREQFEGVIWRFRTSSQRREMPGERRGVTSRGGAARGHFRA